MLIRFRCRSRWFAHHLFYLIPAFGPSADLHCTLTLSLLICWCLPFSFDHYWIPSSLICPLIAVFCFPQWDCLSQYGMVVQLDCFGSLWTKVLARYLIFGFNYLMHLLHSHGMSLTSLPLPTELVLCVLFSTDTMQVLNMTSHVQCNCCPQLNLFKQSKARYQQWKIPQLSSEVSFPRS